MHHGGLLVQRGQVGGAGDVAAHGAGKVVNVQRYAIFGDGGPQDGNVRRRGHGRLQRSGGVGQNQVHISGHKGIDDSGAGVGITCGVLHIKGDRVAQLLGQRVNKALGGGIQGLVGHLLADAHRVGGGALGGGAAVRGRGGAGAGGTAAGGQRQDHGAGSGHSGHFRQNIHSSHPSNWCK